MLITKHAFLRYAQNPAFVFSSVLIFFLAFPLDRAMAATYDEPWWFGPSNDSPAARMRVVYSYPSSVAAGESFPVGVTLILEKQDGKVDSIDIGDIGVSIREIGYPNGQNIEEGTGESIPAVTRINRGEAFSHGFALKAPQVPGSYYVILEFSLGFNPPTYIQSYHWDAGEEIEKTMGALLSIQVEAKPQDYQEEPVLLTVRTDSLAQVAASESFIVIDENRTPVGDVIATEELARNSTHQVSVPPSIQLGEGRQAKFVTWSDGEVSNDRSVRLGGSMELFAIYKPQYLLEIENAEPGDVPSQADWHDAGAEVDFSAKQPSGIFETRIFDHWEGDFSATSTSGSVVMDSPKEVTAVWREDGNKQISSMATILGIASSIIGVGGFAWKYRGRLVRK